MTKKTERVFPVCDRPGCRNNGRETHGIADLRHRWPHRSVEVACDLEWTIELTATGDGPWRVTVYLNTLVLDLDDNGVTALSLGLAQAKRRMVKANRQGAHVVEGGAR